MAQAPGRRRHAALVRLPPPPRYVGLQRTGVRQDRARNDPGGTFLGVGIRDRRQCALRPGRGPITLREQWHYATEFSIADICLSSEREQQVSHTLADQPVPQFQQRRSQRGVSADLLAPRSWFIVM